MGSGYDSNKGQYVKIGRTVHCHFTIRIASSTNPANGQHFVIGGLPFDIDNSINGVTTDYAATVGGACLRDSLSSNQIAYFNVGAYASGGSSIILSCHYSTANSGYTQRAINGSFTYQIS